MSSSNSKCPVCGTPLPGDAPLGLCPRCLLGQVVGGEVGRVTPCAPLLVLRTTARTE